MDSHKTDERLCPFCDKSFPSDMIRKHIGISYLGFNESFEIKEEPLTFELEFELTNVDIFCCDFCGKIYSNNGKLRQHILMTHKSVDFECDICEKTFEDKRGLKMHEKVFNHCNFRCDICDKNYLSKTSLNQHIKRVHGVKLNCSLCSKSYVERRNLNRHVRSFHNGNKTKWKRSQIRYDCPKCSKTFSEKFSVN